VPLSNPYTFIAVKILELENSIVMLNTVTEFWSHGCEEVNFFLELEVLQTRFVYDDSLVV
jgi:hypothetical protein